MNRRVVMQTLGAVAFGALVVFIAVRSFTSDPVSLAKTSAVPAPTAPVPAPVLDTAAYDLKLRQLAHADQAASASDVPLPPWPVHAVYPKAGALLPFHRVVAYFGNFYATGMGALGQYPPDEMLARLTDAVKQWEAADPSTPVIPGIDYIAVTAQMRPGTDGMYRLRMPGSQIEKALALAARVHGIVILEVQPGWSDFLTEAHALEPYLSLPNVQLALDPEFATREKGKPPGMVVGTVDAAKINAVADYLATLVKAHDLPPKILIVHRYQADMVTNAPKIVPLPEVQIVMDMDGWGPPARKFDSYRAYIASQPVQFTGFKLFYRNDVLQPGARLLTPAEILKLTPQPSFIQYQ